MHPSVCVTVGTPKFGENYDRYSTFPKIMGNVRGCFRWRQIFQHCSVAQEISEEHSRGET